MHIKSLSADGYYFEVGQDFYGNLSGAITAKITSIDEIYENLGSGLFGIKGILIVGEEHSNEEVVLAKLKCNHYFIVYE